MAAYPVLDDCTKDASVIGFAATADDAFRVFAAKMVEWHGPDHGMPAPAFFAHREPSSLAPRIAEECPSGAYEPVFARS